MSEQAVDVPKAAVGQIWRKFKDGERLHDLRIAYMVGDKYAMGEIVGHPLNAKTRIRLDSLGFSFYRHGERFHYEFYSSGD